MLQRTPTLSFRNLNKQTKHILEDRTRIFICVLIFFVCTMCSIWIGRFSSRISGVLFRPNRRIRLFSAIWRPMQVQLGYALNLYKKYHGQKIIVVLELVHYNFCSRINRIDLLHRHNLVVHISIFITTSSTSTSTTCRRVYYY